MAISRELQGAAFEPSDIQIMTAAYELTLERLGVARTDPATAALAKQIVLSFRTGERDPHWLCQRVIAQLRD